jgi:hypothetical protein
LRICIATVSEWLFLFQAANFCRPSASRFHHLLLLC